MKFFQRIKLQWARHQQRWFGKWHVYLGIVAGLIVVVTGLTGSILVFQDEIDHALNPGKFHVMEQQQRIELADIVPVVRQKYPQLKFNYVMLSDTKGDPNLAYRFFNLKTKEEFFIDPYTAQLSGKRIYESAFIHIVTDIHRSLLVPVAGRYIVGLSTLCLLMLTISGLRLWIPQKWKQLKSVLTVKFSAGFKRQNYDWHNVLGFYSSPVIALISLTGICITFSPLVIAMIFILDGRSPQGVAALLGAKSTYTTGAKPLTPHDIVAEAKKQMPYLRVAGIALPEDSTGNYRLDVVGAGLPKSGRREMIILDQYTGKVLLNSRKDFPNSGYGYLSWVTPIHFGTFGGLPTRILALLAGLMPLALFVTGFIIWLPRYRKQKRQRRKKAASANYDLATSAANRHQQLLPTDTATETSLDILEDIDEYPEVLVFKKRRRTISAAWQCFYSNLKAGFKYAVWFVVIGFVMGALYGLFSGVIIQPAIFAVTFTTFIVIMNFAVALPVYAINVVILSPFKKGSRSVVRYFAISLAFLLVYVAVYLLLLNTGMKVF
ncbi:PepSY-associated TM helix domain-containing protein [Filimonas effusa]|uniref:PepSY domain-containing protein n=1 Tax=Filimonas effusa TaxID=2508721 RepID=A0A4Q1DB09_9BACT|nr:PepSY-associated TM helix domain-containing protein [Filimonas effusa]RXK86612.1 PepSY domain-containing protein [Filimonas effusa]